VETYGKMWGVRMNKRILTLVVAVDQDSIDRSWIWKSLLQREYINGVQVTAIADGDLTLKDLEEDEEEDDPI